MNDDTGRQVQALGVKLTGCGCLILVFGPVIVGVLLWVASWFT